MSIPLVLALAVLTWTAGVEAAEHEGLGAVRQRGSLRICADPSNLPYTSNDPATPGFEAELAQLLARELGVAARFEWHSTYVRALRPLREGACELFMGLPRDERFREGNPWIAVSRPYYTMGHAWVARVAAEPVTVAGLAGQRVAIERGSVADFFIGDKGVQRGLYRTQEEAFQAVADGQAAATLLWLPFASWLARGKREVRVVPLRDAQLEFPIGAGTRRRERDLTAAVDAALGRLLDSGQAGEILARYGATPPRDAARRAGEIMLVQARDPAAQGGSLFSTMCSRCHGAEGVGGGLGGAVPPLRNYDAGRDKFFRALMQGRKGTAMVGFKGILTDEEAQNLYEYLTSRTKQ